MQRADISHSRQAISWDAQQEVLTMHLMMSLKRAWAVRVYSWQRGLEWSSADHELWELETFCELEEPGLDLLAVSHEPAVEQWQRTIPHPVLCKLRWFESWRFALLRLCCHEPAAIDLLNGNPVLLWLLMDYLQRQPTPPTLAQCRQLLAMRQPDIMAYIGLVATRSAMRQLRKLKLASFGARQASLVRHVFSRADCVQQLQHLQVIHPGLLEVILSFPWLGPLPLAAVFNKGSNNTRRLPLLRDAVRMCRLLQLDAARYLGRCASYTALRSAHDTLTDRLNEQTGVDSQGVGMIRDRHGRARVLPAPPDPGTGQIRPLTSQQHILNEGKRMKHCVASYVGQVLAGGYYIYHVEHDGEPATLGVLLREGRITRMDQLQGIRNRQVSPALRRLVGQWLRSAMSGQGG